LFERFGHLFGADGSKVFPPDASTRIIKFLMSVQARFAFAGFPPRPLRPLR
jgi:hypothetical protein